MAELLKHRFSNLFEKSPGDLALVKASISLNGYDPHQPIVLYDGQILDGYHRYTACRELGIEPLTREFNGGDKAALEYVWSMNYSRRHLSQRAKVMSLIIRNDMLPRGNRLTRTEIAAEAGKESRRLVDQLIRLNDDAPEIAAQVARGEKRAAEAIREALKEQPGGSNHTRQLLLKVTSAKLKEGFWAAQEKHLMTDAQAINKAIQLFLDWSKAH